MQFYDIFNGDADGICALQQLRLEEPRASVLVTGVKRDVRLLERVNAAAGDELTVLDISLRANATDLKLSIHPHPTLTETLMESAEVFFGQATHVYRPRR